MRGRCRQQPFGLHPSPVVQSAPLDPVRRALLQGHTLESHASARDSRSAQLTLDPPTSETSSSLRVPL